MLTLTRPYFFSADPSVLFAIIKKKITPTDPKLKQEKGTKTNKFEIVRIDPQKRRFKSYSIYVTALNHLYIYLFRDLRRTLSPIHILYLFPHVPPNKRIDIEINSDQQTLIIFGMLVEPRYLRYVFPNIYFFENVILIRFDIHHF